MPSFALTIFIGAFLLFQVQPLIGKYILPWFGGGPGVWATCMLFFQVLLLGGYAYAHGISRWLKPRSQAIVHSAMLLVALVFLPITPADAWKPTGAEDPSLRILGLLAITIGLPYLVLSATGPLMQQWFSLKYPGRNPYRLYALSNVGSLLALVSYPFLFETVLTRKAQAQFWGWGLVAYVIAAGYCAWKLWGVVPTSADEAAGPDPAAEAQPDQNQTTGTKLLWLLLPACASVLLLATTNKLCLDVAVIPFLWVAPLAVYLLTFIIAFDSPRWYLRIPFSIAFAAALGAMVWVMEAGSDWSVKWQVTVYCLGLFICCLVCHGELYRLRPAASRLTAYFLTIATGGALGGVFVALVAPLIFTYYHELHWGLLATGAVYGVVLLRAGQPTSGEPVFKWLGAVLPAVVLVGAERLLQVWWIANSWGHRSMLTGLRVLLIVAAVLVLLFSLWRLVRRRGAGWQGWTLTWWVAGLLVLGGGLWQQAHKSGPGTLYMSRNFYGVLTIYDNGVGDPESHHRLLQHGRITHGLQFQDPVQSSWATTYFGQETGIGIAIRSLPESARRIGIVGLGTGTIAAYGRPGDYIRFYEINPEVIRIATNQFTYFTNCAAKKEVALGDARLSMEREEPQRFDLLALDAFSSDSIPVHLLTREAFELYQRHVKTNGVIAVHISNHYLDLEPVVLNLARQFHYRAVKIDYEERDDAWWVYSCTWMLLSRDQAYLAKSEIKAATTPIATNRVDVPLWTDDFASLFQIFE